MRQMYVRCATKYSLTFFVCHAKKAREHNLLKHCLSITGTATVIIGKLAGVKVTPKVEPDPDLKKPPKPPKPGNSRRAIQGIVSVSTTTTTTTFYWYNLGLECRMLYKANKNIECF